MSRSRARYTMPSMSKGGTSRSTSLGSEGETGATKRVGAGNAVVLHNE